MKKLFTRLTCLFLLFEIICSFMILNSQSTLIGRSKIQLTPEASSNFLLSVQNLKQTAANKLEFDVYLQNTLPVGQPAFELASLQLAFLINTSIHTDGVLTMTLSNTGSGLNTSEQFKSSGLLVTSNPDDLNCSDEFNPEPVLLKVIVSMPSV